MQWSHHIREGLAPAMALGIIAASVLLTMTNKAALPPVAAASIMNTGGGNSGAGVTRDLWAAGAPTLLGPVKSGFLTDTIDPHGGVWIETRAVPTVIGTSYGKLIVSREFGPSDEADAADIIQHPDAHVVAVSLAFHPFNAGEDAGVWARFTPGGDLIDQSGIVPAIDHYAGVTTTAQCSAPTPQERAARS